jgi:hypothetical protein
VLEGNIPRFPWTNDRALHPQAHMRAHWQHREAGVDRNTSPASTRPICRCNHHRTTHPTDACVHIFLTPRPSEPTPGKSSHVNVGCRQGGPGR